MKRCSLYMVLALCLNAQTPPTSKAVAPNTFTYYSYAQQPPAVAPPGTQMMLSFPNQATGAQLVRAGCTTYESLKYAHYTYDGTWHGPVSGPVLAYFSKFYESTKVIPLSSGLSGDIAFTGSIAKNTDPVGQVLIQAYYWAADQCYEYGPEVGFYRLLFHPGDKTEESKVYFYYAMHGNCYGDASAGTCRDKTTGASLQPNTATYPIVVPAANSKGGKNWVYSALLTTATNFHVTITDPYTKTDAVTPIDYHVDPTGWFGPTAAAMFSPGLPGYLTVTQQRNSPQGGITDSMTSPVKMTIMGLAQLAYLTTAAPPPVFSQVTAYSRAYGNCEEGNHTVITAGVASSTTTPVMRSYPGCTVNVYAPGTGTPATIYADSSGTPKGNPFTADTTGRWFFYAANGSYDVRLSGAGIPNPFTLGDIPLFSLTSYFPHSVLAYPQGGNAGIMAVYNSAGTFYSGFTSGMTTNNLLWTLPVSDGIGCLASNGSFVLSWVNCTPVAGGGGGGTVTPPGGTNQTIQYNNSGVFGGDGNLIWDKLNQMVAITGTGGTPAIRVNGGYILAQGGIVTNVGSWQGFNTDKDGGLFRGMHIAPTAAGTKGGYLNMAPLGYGNTPLPLDGLASFGLHNALLWVAGTNTMPPDITYGLNTNVYINAAGGLATTNTRYNSIQAPNGGVSAQSLTALNYIQSGNSNGPPAMTGGDSPHAGALYYDTAIGAEQVYTGAGWISLGTGGTGGAAKPPGGVGTSVQFNAGGGNFGGDTFFYYSTNTHLLTVQATDNVHAGIAVGNGYMQADAGFLATTGTAVRYNVFSAPTGGVAAQSITATNYIQSGSSSGAPAPTTGDSFHPGALYWDTSTAGMKVYNGTSWVALTSGGGAVPGGSSKSVQYNTSGAFGGSSFFFYDSPTQLLTVTALNATSAGIAVGTGFIQADAGFLSVTCARYNCFQAASPGGAQVGGMAAKSFTATTYIQAGNYGASLPNGPAATTSDTFQKGALSYNTNAGCLAVYDGSGWGCVGGTGGGGSGTPGGPTTAVQFNSSGAFGGSANFTWDNTNVALKVTGQSGTLDFTSVGSNYIYSLNDGVLNHTVFALAKSGTNGILRISNGSGTGGFDTNGAQIYATASDGMVQANVYKAGNTGTGLTFSNSNSNFQVNGDGAVSAFGVISSTGANGGVNVVNNSFWNSIQTTGGFNANSLNTTNPTAYAVAGSTVITGGGIFTGPAIAVSGLIGGGGLSITGGGTSILTGPLIAQSTMALTGTLSLSGTGVNGWINQYRGTATKGWGVPAIYYNYATSGLVSSVPVTQITMGGSTPFGGYYRVSMGAVCIPTGGSPTGSVFVIFGAVNTVYSSFPSMQLNCAAGPYINAQTITVLTDGNTNNGCAALCFSASASGFANGNYSLYVFTERLQ